MRKINDDNERSDQYAQTKDMSWHTKEEQMGEEVLVDTFAVAVRSVESLREGLRLKNGRSLNEAAMRDFGSFKVIWFYVLTFLEPSNLRLDLDSCSTRLHYMLYWIPAYT